eukprot:3540200-Pyramimonas_sp.AAC.1
MKKDEEIRVKRLKDRSFIYVLSSPTVKSLCMTTVRLEVTEEIAKECLIKVATEYCSGKVKKENLYSRRDEILTEMMSKSAAASSSG